MVARIRSINQVVKYMKEQDPETRITYNLIKNAVERGEIHSFKSGNRTLITLEEVYRYFFNQDIPTDEETAKEEKTAEVEPTEDSEVEALNEE